MSRPVVLLICITTVLFGCSTLPRQTDTETEGYARYSDLVRRNESLKSFKGIGEATLRKEGRSHFGRLAWAGLEPDQLRVEIIGVPGQPKIGFSSDGAWVYYFDSEGMDSAVKRVSAKNPNLERFLAVSITASEIVSFLAGRLPDYRPHAVQMARDPGGEGYILVLTSRWWQPDRQEIFLGPEKREIRKIEHYTGRDLSYRVEFPKMQTIDGYRVPSEMRISDANGNFFRLSIARYWANASISPGLFRLEPPKGAAGNPSPAP